MAKKPFAVKGINVTSPKGKAAWCKIKEPDYEYDDKGTLSTKLVVHPDDPGVAEFIEKLEELRDIALAETKETLGAKGNKYQPYPVFTMEEDQDGEETGNIVFNFKMKAVEERAEKGWQHTITVVDAKRQRVKDEDVPLVGNGSIIRCVAYANPYSSPKDKVVGISLIWSKMQLIELVEYDGAGADDFEDEDGFSSNESDAGNEFDNEEDDF